ncbi:MAG: peptidase M48 [Bacteroidetes bacterium]|nr:MAG: peptidase M48 [Bacteroidota bacterium]
MFVVLAFSYCAVNPVTGKKQVALMSEAQEIAMGAESDPQIVAQFGLYPDSNLQRFINQKGMEMARISHRPNLKWTFRVLDSDVINAFAVPGGYVYFTRGILAAMNNEAQFAGVLGHEIGHVTARHSVSQQTSSMLTQLGVMAAVIANRNVAQFANELSQGAQLLMLSFSRKHESESDELGVEYSSKVGYNATYMADFFRTLQRQQQSSGHAALPEFLSTHPDPGNRFERVQQLASAYQTANGLVPEKLNIRRNEYLQVVQGIMYGENPRHGFVENGVFYHPDLKFQFATPTGWRYQNTPQQVLFSAPAGDAMCFLALAKGKTPQEAATNFAQTHKIQVASQQNTNFNGLSGLVVQGSQVQANAQGQAAGSVQLTAAFVAYNGLVYELVGASTPQVFQNYLPQFNQMQNSMRSLTNAAMLNVKPERIVLYKLPKAATLQQVLQDQKMPAQRFSELAILNGLELGDNIPAQTTIKLVRRS